MLQTLAPALHHLVPAEYHKWTPLVRRYVARSIGVSVAWWLYRLIAALHSALRGADLVVKGGLGYAVRHGYVPAHSLKVALFPPFTPSPHASWPLCCW